MKWEGCPHKRDRGDRGRRRGCEGKYKLNNFSASTASIRIQPGVHPLPAHRPNIDGREVEDDDEDAGDSSASKRSDESASRRWSISSSGAV